ncbi:hypothetical protein FSC37_09255 [Piscinibacter aquaticus]|uniref:Uncharacterized protein n=1 Tax=Piscinibacter aquaticus TaxID=392597 RepID=A0A5C6U2P9_9BURK|nr:hypothetical protein FSC37_09255 [Piscinibacter aquaticus]
MSGVATMTRDEREAHDAVLNCLHALVIAAEKCEEADYGHVHVLDPLNTARVLIHGVLRVLEGRS